MIIFKRFINKESFRSFNSFGKGEVTTILKLESLSYLRGLKIKTRFAEIRDEGFRIPVKAIIDLNTRMAFFSQSFSKFEACICPYSSLNGPIYHL